MIDEVNMNESTWNQIPLKFEAGTANIAQVIGLGEAIDYVQNIGIEKIYQHEKELLTYCLQKFSEIDELKILFMVIMIKKLIYYLNRCSRYSIFVIQQ